MEPDGVLAVPGSRKALGMWVESLMDEVDEVTMLTLSSDLHHPLQIFFPTLWMYGTGRMAGQMLRPSNFVTGEITYVRSADLDSGLIVPTYDPDWQDYYVRQLESSGGKTLTIYDFHCMEGSLGAAFVPAVQVATKYWEGRRGARASVWFKGNFWGTEMYAPQEAEVPHPHDTNSVITGVYDDLEEADETEIGGLAETHCVLEFNKKNVKRFENRRPEVLATLTLRRSMTAPIPYPGYEQELAANYQLFAQHNIRVID